MKTFKSLLIALLITSSTVFAHGENMQGPHGGEIRMPGAFHTEVVTEGPRDVKVYLLDVKFESPTTENSSVSLRFEGDQNSEATCTKQEAYFACRFEKEVLNSKGTLHVTANRQNKKGRMVHYPTPLKFGK